MENLKIDPVAALAPAAPITAPSIPTPNPASSTVENIFSKQKEPEKEATVIKSILEQKAAQPKIKPILGEAPVLQKSLEEEKYQKQKRTLRTVQSLFVLVFVAALGMTGYFHSELSPKFDLFGPNSTAKLTDINKNLRSSQTIINKYRYLGAQLELNAFSFISDDLLDKTAQMAGSAEKLQSLLPAATELVAKLPSILQRAKEDLAPSVVIPTYQTQAEEKLTEDQLKTQAESSLKTALQEDYKKIASAGSNLTLADEQELRLLDNTIKLVGNTRVQNAIKGLNGDAFAADLDEYIKTLDSAKRMEISNKMQGILLSTKSDIATIGGLKSIRISWSWIIEKIEEITRKVDPNFNAGLFEVTGKEIVYTGYEFDTKTKKIVLSGITRTNDAKNFSLISDLIIELERSDYFENVEMRSFSKSGSLEEGFTANFKVDLNIEPEKSASAKNTAMVLSKKKVAVKGVKRIPSQ